MGAASQELTERAKLLISERRYQEAVRACRRALLSQPDQVEVRLLLGEALLALERYDEVRVEMMALARKMPDRAEVHRVLGEAYLRDNRPTQAVESLRRALSLDPNDEIAKELLSEAANENAPVSTTIERWFADEAAPTIETEAPAWVETVTPVPATSAEGRPSQAPPSIQIDPVLTQPAGRAPAKIDPPRPGMGTEPRGPRVRSRKPTMAGHPAAFPIEAPLPPPPARAAAPAPLPPVAKPLEPVPPPPRRELPREATSAQRPSAMRGENPVTDELELTSSDEQEIDDELDTGDAEEFAPLDLVPDELSGEPTNAHVAAKELHEDEPMTYVRGPAPVFAGPPPSAGGFAGPPSAPYASPSSAGAYAAPPAAPYVPPSPPVPAPYVLPPPAYAPPDPIPQATPVVRAKPASDSLAPPARPAPVPTARVSRAPQRWILPAAIGGAVVVLVGIVGALVISAWMDASAAEAIRDAARGAGDTGQRSDIEAAIAAIDAEETDEPELLALKARLLASLALEHDQDRIAEIDAILVQLGAEPTTDARIAAALRDLDRGEAGEALQRLSGLTAEGEQIAEAFRARALATAALGRFDEAEESAEQAASLRAGAPRHAALHALMRHRTGDSAGALTMLDATAGGDRAPAVRLARARILQESGSDPARALEEASAVIDELAARATPHELAWAHLVRARVAVADGDGARALAEARAASEHPPPSDEAFGMQLVETLLRAGAPEDASAQLAHLPQPPVDAPARAMLAAEVAIAVGDLAAADAALAQATDGPRKSLLRAQVLEARGQPEQARPLYEQAMQAPGPEGRRARVRLAAIAMGSGDAARAITLLEPARPGAEDDLELVPLLARAYLERGRVEEAQQIVDVALSRRAGAAELLAARGAVQLRRGQVTEALASLRSAVAARPGDADLQADLGDAARRAGDAAAARTAFDAALALRADSPRALVGLARLALAQGDFAQVEQRLEAAARTRREALEVARLRAELAVTRGDGAIGVALVEPLVREHDDAALWTLLGHLQAQAEQDRDAGRSFARALRRDRDNPEALLGDSLVLVRRGDLGGARRAISTAAEVGERRALGADFRARLAVARGRLEFENGDFDSVVRLANEATQLDAHNASAHLLLANVAIEREDSPVEHLRRAVSGHAPPPEALGRLAPRIPAGEEACTLARRYLEVAPRGYDAPDVRDVVSDCR